MATQMRNKLATCKEQVREAYRNGATLREIGEVHGVSAGTVRNALIEMGEEMRPRGRRKKADRPDTNALAAATQPTAPIEPVPAPEPQAPVAYEGGTL